MLLEESRPAALFEFTATSTIKNQFDAQSLLEKSKALTLRTQSSTGRMFVLQQPVGQRVETSEDQREKQKQGL